MSFLYIFGFYAKSEPLIISLYVMPESLCYQQVGFSLRQWSTDVVCRYTTRGLTKIFRQWISAI